MDTQRVIQIATQAAADFGVERFGVCRLQELSQLLECRGRQTLPATGSVLILLLPYYTGPHPGRNLSLYAVPDDYHRIAGGILDAVAAALRRAFPGESFLPFVDSSPIPEVEAACRAGLGFRGRNGQLITPEYGSLCFMAEIVTALELEPTRPPARLPADCGDCRICVEACPTGALSGEGMETARCRSALTQKKGELTPWEEQQIAKGGYAWGCDLCTLACPHNRAPRASTIPQFHLNLQPVLSLDTLDSQMENKSYIWRGKAVLRRNLELIANQ